MLQTLLDQHRQNSTVCFICSPIVKPTLLSKWHHCLSSWLLLSTQLMAQGQNNGINSYPSITLSSSFCTTVSTIYSSGNIHPEFHQFLPPYNPVQSNISCLNYNWYFLSGSHSSTLLVARFCDFLNYKSDHTLHLLKSNQCFPLPPEYTLNFLQWTVHDSGSSLPLTFHPSHLFSFPIFHPHRLSFLSTYWFFPT